MHRADVAPALARDPAPAMANQLLWLETLLKLLAGLPLLLAPTATARLLGLPLPGSTLWPRLLGAALVGLAAASYMQGALGSGRGLGFAGAMVINLVAAATIAAMLIMRRANTTTRGVFVLWTVAAILALLSFFELAWA